MILDTKLRKFAEETTDMLYNIYYKQILNGEISPDIQKEYYSSIVDDTLKYFLRIEDYEKCEKLGSWIGYLTKKL
jgi:hypothetical protein